MPTCYVVLGTTRSGTSVVTGLLHRLGVVMGWELQSEDGNPRFDWPDATPMNPYGFFQDAPVENVQDSIWGDEYPPEGTRPEPDARVEEFKRLIRIRCERKHPKWGLKASRNQWMIPELLEACTDEVKFVVTSRPKILSAKSLDVWFPEYGLTRCNEWVRRATQQIENVLVEHSKIPRLIVGFDRLFDDKESVLSELAAFVGASLSDHARDLVDENLRRVK